MYNVKDRALIKGSKIVAEGYFSGLKIGVPRINLETKTGDTVFRLALRYDLVLSSVVACKVKDGQFSSSGTP